jgi:hypothetical protein
MNSPAALSHNAAIKPIRAMTFVILTTPRSPTNPQYSLKAADATCEEHCGSIEAQ